jgi:hypothetical protein
LGNPSQVTWGNSKYVVVGGDQYTTGGKVFTSSDGTSWTAQTSNTAYYLYDVAFGNNLFVSVGEHGTILTSPDAITWTSRTSGTLQKLAAITWGDSTYVAVSDSGRILTSPNGTTWTIRSSDSTNLFRDVYFGNHVFVAVAAGGKILTSPNGTTWTAKISGTSQELKTGAFGQKTYVALGSNTILSSSIPVSIATTPEHLRPVAQTICTISGRTIHYTITNAAQVSMQLFDIRGRCALTLNAGRIDAGSHAVTMPSNLAAGRYILALSIGNAIVHQPILLVK